MTDWRNTARELLPELEALLREAENPWAFWLDVHGAFEQAYRPPQNDDMIRRVYAFADWCLQSGDGDDLSTHLPTCVALCFYEDIPTCKTARADMPRWFKREDVELMKSIFSYHLSEKEFEELLHLFPESRSDRKRMRAERRRKR